MNGRKPSTSAASPRLRDVGASALLLGLIIGGAFTIDRPTERDDPDATTTLASTHLDSTSREQDPDSIMPRAVDVRPVRAEETESGCYAALHAAEVAYASVARADAGTVEWPILLTGPIAGVRVHGSGKADAPTNYLDCRLARTLLTWAPFLRARGVVGLEHYSIYRAESVVATSNKPSGHASGRAIDVAKFELSDGRSLSVLDDWTNRARGGDPCRVWPDDEDGRLMRQLVCEAAAQGLFNTVVTPHHNDAHANHVHLEYDPQGKSLWIH